MKYANKISDIINAFSPAPLRMDQMEEFYCENTMEYRTNDKYNSPIDDIFDGCKNPEERAAFLLLGHRGCGKSTELNRMSQRLNEEGYFVKTVACGADLDLFNIVYSDLFILMGEALLKIAEESGCEIEPEILRDMECFWREGTETVAAQETGAVSFEAGMSAECGGIFRNIFNLFARMKSDLKYNEEVRKEYRRKISVRSSEWMHLLGQVAEKIAQNTGGKYPVIIFEDLDKLNPEDAWNVFYNYAAILSGMAFPVIYTFPIGLSYDTRFAAMESYFVTKTLPMIKIETLEGASFDEGIEVIQKLVEKRAKEELFDTDVLKKLIQYTGGSLRDLFHAINASAKRAQRRNSETISNEDAKSALEELKTSLTRRIEEKDYAFLLNIKNGNRELIADREKLLKMLQASVVLEYNGKRWHNVHPLVAEFLEDQGLDGNVGE